MYSIRYQTRTKSAEFLEDIINKIAEYSIDLNNSIKTLNKEIVEQWNSFTEKNKDFDNVDNYHFFSAFLTIKAWFNNREENFISEYINKIKEHTRFIWYLDNSEDDAKLVFRNLNSGKIPLTNAELIKALFINNFKNNNKEALELQKITFASEWDIIEQMLQNDDFWYFVNNSTDKSTYQTRIDFIFELIVNKPKAEKDTLYSYRKYAIGKEPLDWQKVKKYFNKLKEWYDRPKWYHLIGYIIDRGFKDIQSLVKLSSPNSTKESISKIDFENILYQIIRDEFTKINGETMKYDLNVINYEDNYEEVKNILFLFTIEYYLKNIKGVRFPFKEFKNTHWSLEHIHAQNADDIQTYSELEAFIGDIECINKELEDKYKTEVDETEKRVLKDKINEYNINVRPKIIVLSESTKAIDKKESELRNEDKKVLHELMPFVNEFLEVHKVSNMALLDQPTNSGLGKRNFPDKRDYLINLDKKSWTLANDDKNQSKPYIPPTTLNVFLKYYTRGEKQYKFWGYQDRTDYLEEIKETLKPYFEESR